VDSLNNKTVCYEEEHFYMGRKPKLSSSEKLEAVKQYLDKQGSYRSIASKYGVNQSSLKRWVQKYESMGADSLVAQSHNKFYTNVFKQEVVQAYLAGEGSYLDLSKKFQIPSDATIINWVIKYNGHEELKATGMRGATTMTKGRTTTFDERVDIVKYCIENKNDYTKTADKFQVSYQQVYSWVQKYEKAGIEGLQDRRGKQKPENELSEVEKLKAQNKLLQAENRKKQMEIDFLKKLEEIERRRS